MKNTCEHCGSKSIQIFEISETSTMYECDDCEGITEIED